jgi:hypothetical protein
MEKCEGEELKQAASWGSRLCIWLDPDGLLHLICTDPAVPEVTLTLSDPSLAWWMSDGTIGGREFFLPPGVTATPDAVQRLQEAIHRMTEISYQE